MYWLSSAISSLIRMIGFSLLCLLIDYGIYFSADVLYARRLLVASKQRAVDQNAVWRRLCGLLLVAALPIHLLHHRPLLLYLLISVTFLLTLRQSFDQYWRELSGQWPFLVTVGGAFQRIIAVFLELIAKWFEDILLLVGGRKHGKHEKTASGGQLKASSGSTDYNYNYNSSAFHRFVPPAASTLITTSTPIDRDGASSKNQFGVSQRFLPTSTQQLRQQKPPLPVDRRLHSDDYLSEPEQKPLLLRDHQPLSKDYYSPQQRHAMEDEEQDSLLSNGSLLHPPRRSFLKTSTPVDPATVAKGSSCHLRA